MGSAAWSGRLAVVTGASSGIGAAIAEELAAVGARLVLSGRNTKAMDDVVGRYVSHGVEAVSVVGDLREDAVRQRVVNTARGLGGIDLLINNAGITMNARFLELEPSVIRRIMEINFFAAVELTRLTLPSLMEHRGRIVVMSSITGLVGTPTRTAYAASKHALHGFFDSLRVELRNNDVSVTVVCPGYVATPMRERALLADGSEQGSDQAAGRRMLSAEEVSRRSLDAAWKRRRLLKLGRETWLARFLSIVAPGLLDSILAKATL